MGENISIFISAGDPSADYYGQRLIEEMRHLCGDVSISGLGGPLMQKAGLNPLADHKELAVLGFWEIVPKYFFFRKLLKKAVREIENRRPGAVILIDYPGFNLRLAARIKKLGIPIVYYISPQVWAWGKGRVGKIRQLVDLMIVIFPFEEAFYKEHGVPVVFGGHPIVDRFADIPDKAVCRERLGLSGKTVALLPGSRIQEVKRMLPCMLDAAEKIRRETDSVSFVIAGVENVPSEVYGQILNGRDIPIVVGKTPYLMNGAELVITSSGTATVETAYFMTPMIVIYKTGTLTYHIAKRIVKLDSIAMVNIVAGKKIVPELIQHEASGKTISREAISLLKDASRYEGMVDDLKAVRQKLGSGNATQNTSREIVRVAGLC